MNYLFPILYLYRRWSRSQDPHLWYLVPPELEHYIFCWGWQSSVAASSHKKTGACYKWRVLGGDCVLSVSSSSGNVKIRTTFYNNTSSFQLTAHIWNGARSKDEGARSREQGDLSKEQGFDKGKKIFSYKLRSSREIYFMFQSSIINHIKGFSEKLVVRLVICWIW